MNAVFFLTFYS